MHWERIQQWRRQDLGKLERRSKWEWSELYGRQEAAAAAAGERLPWVLGRFRAWRELGGKLREIGGTIRGRTEVLGALSGGVGDPATLGADLAWESAFTMLLDSIIMSLATYIILF